MAPQLSRRLALTLGLGAALAAPAALAAKSDAPARVLTGALPAIPGPRRTVAVGNFDVMGPYANPSATNVGGPIAAMLTSALSESDRFIVVERDAAAQMILELDMGKSGVTAGSAAPHPGHMLPAQYLVVGSVTEFTATGPGSGNGGGLSIGGSTALTVGASKGAVALDVRIVDTRTGQVVKAFKVRRQLSAANVGVSGAWKGVPIATTGFFNTPLGEATRRALNDAVLQIDLALGAIAWRGQIVKAEGGVIYVNAGAEAGIMVGDRLGVERVGETFTDPATGAVLSEHLVEMGVVTITGTEPKMAVGRYQAVLAGDPVRGDFVIPVAR